MFVSTNSLHLVRYAENVGVQYEVGKDAMLDVNYVGNIGRRLHNGMLNPLNRR
jgi:hypothetical protein